MPTGACGINCDVCRLNLKGVCTSCGPGVSDTAARKLAVQERILGSSCPVLACARLNGIAHCSRDCDSFPCENFSRGPYPFSQSYLEMQMRRRKESAKAYAPDGSHLEVAPLYWETLAQKDLTTLCNHTFFEVHEPGRLTFDFLNETLQIDIQRRCLRRQKEGQWQPSEDPLLTLATAIYLNQVDGVYPLGQDIVGIADLKESHFFCGPHELRTQPLLARYGEDIEGFCRAGAALKGHPRKMGDAAVELRPYPRVPLYFLLWQGDAEFKPRLQVLLDRSIENYMPADAIWALINRVILSFTD